MKNPSENWEETRRKVLGLGVSSVHKTYYASLRKRLAELERLRAKLQRSEAYLAEAERLTRTGTSAHSMNRQTLYWSAEMYRLYNFDPRQGMPTREQIWQRIHPEDLPNFRRMIERTYSEKVDGDFEFRIVLADGTIKQVRVLVHPILGRDGEMLELVGTNIDITERKRSEEALLRLNRELRAISDCNQVLLRTTDERSLLEEICRIVCEKAGYRMAWVSYAEHDEAKSVRPVAWTGAEAGYLKTADITWADTVRGRGPTGTAIRSGKTCCMQDFATDPRVAPWRDGALQRGFHSGIALPLKDEHANVFGSLTIFSAQPNAFTSEEIRLLEELAGDLAFGVVTLRSRAAREQAEQEVTLLGFAMDNVRVAAFLVDSRGRFQYVNEEACRALGYSRTELLSLGVADIDPGFPAERWSDHWRDLKAQRSLRFDSHHRTKDGRTFPVEISANYFEYGGRAYNLALARDITERKRAQEALEQEREMFISGPNVAYRVCAAEGWPLDYVSPNMEDEFGYVPEALVREHVPAARLIHPYDLPRVAKEVEAHSNAGERYFSLEFRIVHANGECRWVYNFVVVRRNANGLITHYQGYLTDITKRKTAEDALRRSEAYLAEAQKLSHTGSWALDVARNKYVYTSEECFRIFGLDPQEGLPTGKAVLRQIHPGDRNRWKENLEKSLREKVDTFDEYRIVLPDGTTKHIETTRHPVLNTAGDVVQLVGTSIDITERKRAQEALRLSGAYNRSLIEVSLDPLVTIGPDGKITDVNAATEAATGCSRRELIGTDFSDYFTEPAKARAGYKQVFREGVVRDYPLELRHRSGGVMSVLYNASVYRDESGKVIGVFAAARDITERKVAEAALLETEKRFRIFVDHAADAFFMLDFEHGSIIDVNQPACESLGYSREELIGKTPLAFDVDLDRATFESLGKRAAAGETVLFDRHRHRRKDGSTFPVEVHTSVFQHGGRRFLLKVARDISDRVRAEEALKSSEAERLRAEAALQETRTELERVSRVTTMGALTASIAHEVNQPLAGVVTSANAGLNWLAGSPPNLSKTREALERVLRDGTRAGEVIARIRGLLKRTPAVKTLVNVNQIVQEVLALMAGELRGNNVETALDLDPSLPGVRGDTIQLQQVLLNLITNAVEAMAEVVKGKRTLRIQSHLGKLDGKRAVVVEVSDTGKGLRSIDTERLFEAFHTTKPHGMGMGLWISRSIIQEHGGRLAAQPKSGRGATFAFCLPVVLQSE